MSPKHHVAPVFDILNSPASPDNSVEDNVRAKHADTLDSDSDPECVNLEGKL